MNVCHPHSNYHSTSKGIKFCVIRRKFEVVLIRYFPGRSIHTVISKYHCILKCKRPKTSPSLASCHQVSSLHKASIPWVLHSGISLAYIIWRGFVHKFSTGQFSHVMCKILLCIVGLQDLEYIRTPSQKLEKTFLRLRFLLRKVHHKIIRCIIQPSKHILIVIDERLHVRSRGITPKLVPRCSHSWYLPTVASLFNIWLFLCHFTLKW